MSVGKRIKKYRQLRKLSQKELGIMTRMSEPTIRNYELENRNPSIEQLQKIADALEISYFALANPDIDSYHGIMHTLFKLEEVAGITPYINEGEVYLKIKNDTMNSSIIKYIKEWDKVYKQFLNGEITEEDYEEWKITFPEYIAYNCKKKLPSKR